MLAVISEKNEQIEYQKIVFYFKNCCDVLLEKNVLVIEKNFQDQWSLEQSKYSNSKMPEHFLKQLEVSQIQYIGTTIMPIGTNNWDVESYRTIILNDNNTTKGQ